MNWMDRVTSAWKTLRNGEKSADRDRTITFELSGHEYRLLQYWAETQDRTPSECVKKLLLDHLNSRDPNGELRLRDLVRRVLFRDNPKTWRDRLKSASGVEGFPCAHLRAWSPDQEDPQGLDLAGTCANPVNFASPCRHSHQTAAKCPFYEQKLA